MDKMEYILAHGSGNLFVMIDAVQSDIDTNGAAQFVRRVCEHFASDGLLFLEEVTGLDGERYLAMNMYNTDGTQAQMCGNGMRIVARLAFSRYLKRDRFTLYSGGSPYPIVHSEPTVVSRYNIDLAAIPNFGVDIAIRYSSPDFLLSDGAFVAGEIAELDETLQFTYLNLGNPHIVAQVEQVDLEHLSRLGERVKQLPHIFPNGVNVSFMQRVGEQQIFVATYERGVGLTASCGTAMTASSTTAALLGLCRWGEAIDVRNRGGFVRCICSRADGALRTQLIGNATYIEEGEIEYDTESDTLESRPTHQYRSEIMAWDVATNS